eukprot:Nitzschia sp. Nitz4//scaffold10_size219509//83277//83897//NITZ4_001422-RA/size219509-processed-gene-0.127-mRNA-1//-1//CDS//3329532902//2819//frame0
MAPLQDSSNSSRKRPRYEHNDKLEDEAEVLVHRKRVRFAHEPAESTSAAPFGDDTIATTVHESPLTTIPLKKEQLWWSKSERSTISLHTRRLARGFRKNHTERVQHYLHVFDEASKAPTHSTSDYLESATLGVPTEVRGLECGFVPSIKLYRKTHAQEVLDTQQQLQKGCMSEALCQRVLSARAINSSRRSRVMARLMGEADAKQE